MSKMDEMNKFIKEQENLPFNVVGEKCATKTDAIVKKATELNIPWKQIYCQADNGVFDQLHTYAIVDGRKVDVAYDPDAVKALKSLSNRKIYAKTVQDEYFDGHVTWQNIMYSMMFHIGENARILDSSVEKKRIIYLSNENFDKNELKDFISKFGLSCSFKKIEEGIESVTFTKIGKNTVKYKEDAKYKKQTKEIKKRWAIRDNRLRELEKQ